MKVNSLPRISIIHQHPAPSVINKELSEVASICYRSTTNDALRIKRIVKANHLSVLRFASVTISIGCSRACSHQLVRHKHLDYLQESQRYVDQSGLDITVVLKREHALARILITAHAKISMWCYRLLRRWVPKEDARLVLPNCASTGLNIHGNLQAWIDFLNLRLSKSAQPEIRRIARMIYTSLNAQYPLIINQDTITESSNE